MKNIIPHSPRVFVETLFYKGGRSSIGVLFVCTG